VHVSVEIEIGVYVSPFDLLSVGLCVHAFDCVCALCVPALKANGRLAWFMSLHVCMCRFSVLGMYVCARTFARIASEDFTLSLSWSPPLMFKVLHGRLWSYRYATKQKSAFVRVHSCALLLTCM
jgi:hypothetical protein